jgi:hypothetical protein
MTTSPIDFLTRHCSFLILITQKVADPEGTASPGRGVLLRSARSVGGGSRALHPSGIGDFRYRGPPPPEPPGGEEPDPVPMNASTAPYAAANTATVASALLPRENRR